MDQDTGKELPQLIYLPEQRGHGPQVMDQDTGKELPQLIYLPEQHLNSQGKDII